MMRIINGNIDLTSQRTQVVSRLHVRVVEQESGQDAEAKATADTKINNLEYIVFF